MTLSYVRNVAKIDQFSYVPLYQQLAGILQEQIESGQLERLQILPSESQMEQEYQVSRDTVRRAVALLREAGLVFTVPQRGTYVGPKPSHGER